MAIHKVIRRNKEQSGEDMITCEYCGANCSDINKLKEHDIDCIRRWKERKVRTL